MLIARGCTVSWAVPPPAPPLPLERSQSLRIHHWPAALCDQAGAAAQSGDVDVACAMLTDATGIATASGNLTYLDRVRGIRVKLEPHSSAEAVRRLDETLTALTA
jgi:hypothetical protein